MSISRFKNKTLFFSVITPNILSTYTVCSQFHVYNDKKLKYRAVLVFCPLSFLSRTIILFQQWFPWSLFAGPAYPPPPSHSPIPLLLFPLLVLEVNFPQIPPPALSCMARSDKEIWKISGHYSSPIPFTQIT